MGKNISIVVGTRPEAIKLCPVISALRRRGSAAVQVCVTGQHRTMLDQVLAAFEVVPDIDLHVMTPNQRLAELSARLLVGVDRHLAESQPGLVIVQGDTTTALCAAMAAFYARTPVAHVEAGLRTGDPASPFPEEMNRVLVSRLAALHFAPTRRAAEQLVREGVPEERIQLTGNTVVDALLAAVARVRAAPPAIDGVPEEALASAKRLVLVTGHRRESFGAGFESICRAIGRIAARFPDVLVVYPVHLNPNVREPVFRLLGGRPNVRLIEPLGYLPFVRLMDAATVILTDSGGIQEEAPSLAKPVLVMRETTERPEAVEAGVARLVGTAEDAIHGAVAELLTDPAAYARMAGGGNPFGDGHAATRIADATLALLERTGA
jgi:UDP-N-acetylglucosamine 2-epimerase (non-hydrolysing)